MINKMQYCNFKNIFKNFNYSFTVSKRIFIATMLGCILFSTSIYSEDKVIQKNGDIIFGEIVSETRTFIIMKIIKMVIKRKNIKTMKVLSGESAKNTNVMVISMKDGSKVQGNVVDQTDGSILLKGNPYLPDNFRILKKQIASRKKLKRVRIDQKGGLKIAGALTAENADEITIQKYRGRDKKHRLNKKNILTIGNRKLPVKKAGFAWRRPRISVQSGYQAATGRFSDVFPGGVYSTFTFDQGLDFFSNAVKHRWWYPGLRLEAGFIQFEKTKSELNGSIATAGAIWLIPLSNLTKYYHSKIAFATTTGIIYYNVKNEYFSARNYTFMMTTNVAYEFSLGHIFIFVRAEAEYIFDQNFPLVTIGGVFGLGYDF